MSSKKMVCLKKKVREKINGIHEQRNILSAVVDSFMSEGDPNSNMRNRLLEFDTESTWKEVLEDTLKKGNQRIKKSDTVIADDQADRLLDEKDDGQFMKHYLDVMQFLDQSYNSCVLLTAEAESLCENLDVTASELLPKAINTTVDGEEETTLKGATAAPLYKSWESKKMATPEKGSSNSASLKDISTASLSAPVEKQPGSYTQYRSSTPVKPTVRSDEKNEHIENLTENYSKPAHDKSVINISVNSAKNRSFEVASALDMKADTDVSRSLNTEKMRKDSSKNMNIADITSDLNLELDSTLDTSRGKDYKREINIETDSKRDINIETDYKRDSNSKTEFKTEMNIGTDFRKDLNAEVESNRGKHSQLDLRKIKIEDESTKDGSFGGYISRNLNNDVKNTALNLPRNISTGVDSTRNVKMVEQETKKRQELKQKNRKSSSTPGRARLDTDAAARFLRGVIRQAEKDNTSLRNVQQQDFEKEAKQDNLVTKTNDIQKDNSLGIKDDSGGKNAHTNLSFQIHDGKMAPTQENKKETESKAVLAENIASENNLKSTQNDLTAGNAGNSVSVNTNIPLEMNIVSDSSTVTSNSIGQTSLPAHRPTPVVVSETRSPWNFYVQVINSSLEKLMQEIRLYMESDGKSTGKVDSVEGDMVYLAQFSQDQLYYRAKVTDIDTSEYPQGVDVLFIDYGNAEKRDMTHLRQLPPKFATLPSQAVYCALAKIAPNNNYGVWSEQDIVTFSHLAHSKKFFCTLIQRSQNPDIPNIVDLFFNSILPGNCIPTPVFVQTILMNCNIGRMVTIQEQVTSFMIFFQLSPRSNSKLSPPSSHCSSDVKSVKDGNLTAMRQNSADSVTEILYVRQKTCDDDTSSSLVTRQKSCDSNDVCDLNEPLSKENEPSHKISNCDKNKPVIIKEQMTGHCQGQGDEGQKEKPEVNTCISISNEGKMKDQKRESNNVTFADSEKIVHINMDKTECDSAETGSEENRIGDKNSNSIDKTENTGNKIQNEKIVDSLKESSSKTETNVLQITHTNSEMNSNDIQNDRDQNDNLALPTDVPFLNMDKNSNCFNVMVSFVKSPSQFYVHIISEVTANTLNVMSNNINSKFSQLSRKQLQKMSKSLSPQVNDVCCAQFFEDNKYYRAHILEVQAPTSQPKTPDNDSDSECCGKARVFYMDYGDVEWVPKRRLFPLPKELKNTPPLAVKCCLAYIKPKDKKWSADGRGCFNKLTGDKEDKILKMIIVDGNLEKNLESVNSDPLTVILVDSTDKEEICINMDLIEKGFAVLDANEEVPTTLIKGSIPTEKMQDWDPMMEDYFSIRNSYKIDVDDAGVATVGYKANDESRICKYYNIGDCWRGERCPYKHIEVTADGVTQDQELVYGAVDEYYVEKMLPEPGAWVAVEVTTILTPGHFYVSLPFGKSAIDNLKEKEESDKKESEQWQMSFDELISEMQEEYNKANYNEDNTVDKAPGEIIAARYPTDGKWYRARVLIVEESRMRVFFVDFGNREWIRFESIRTILPDFLHLPFQAVECFMLGIEPLGAKYSGESKQRFKALVDGKVLVSFVKTRSYNGIIWVDLYDTTGDEDIDIAKVLSSEKLVQETGSITTTSSKLSSSQGSLILVPG